MPSDIEIAQRKRPKDIISIASSIGIRHSELKLYGNYTAKISPDILSRLSGRQNGKLILVTSITPTKFGEGKTSTAIGLTQGLGRINKKVMLCLREPSLGPVFGIKGGACGGGYSQVVPMEDINLHFTGDSHMVTAANNLLCALIDNHIYFGNTLGIDKNRIMIRRVMDINDRSLRSVRLNESSPLSYSSGFDITAASEVMAVLALSKDIKDLKSRLSRMIVAYDKKARPVTAHSIKATGAMAVLLKEALMPNLVQTLEANPAFVHCGPFANIAHGANSLISTMIALKLADYVVTESGFGSDLGAEKFFDIVCRQGRLKVDIAVMVVSARAIRVNGFHNLNRHIRIIKRFSVKPVVAINRFPGDSNKEISAIISHCDKLGVPSRISDAVSRGGLGAVALARSCVDEIDKGRPGFKYLYQDNISIKEKIEIIAKKVYGAAEVEYSEKAKQGLKKINELRLNKLCANIAKTQFSFTDDKNIKGAPEGFRLKVNDIRIFSGAGFIVAVCGNIMLMPALPKHPAAFNIDTDAKGNIKGLF